MQVLESEVIHTSVEVDEVASGESTCALLGRDDEPANIRADAWWHPAEAVGNLVETGKDEHLHTTGHMGP